MKLADYLAQPGNNASRFATRCGVAVSTITRAARGEMTPSGTLMAVIHDQSGGLVTPNDFFGIAAAVAVTKPRRPRTSEVAA